MILPIFFVVVFTIVEASLYYYGISAAQSAAAACAENARVLNAGPGDGEQAARSVLASADILVNPGITVTRGDTTTCTVTGAVQGPLPKIVPAIHRAVSMPTERLTQP